MINKKTPNQEFLLKTGAILSWVKSNISKIPKSKVERSAWEKDTDEVLEIIHERLRRTKINN